MSLYLDLKNACSKYKNRPCIYTAKKYTTYQDFLKKVDFCADYLYFSLHIHQSSVVSLCLYNSLDSLSLIYALNKLGAIVHLINPNLTSDQISYFDCLSKSRLLILEKNIYHENYDAFKNRKNNLALLDNKNNIFKKFIQKLKYHKQKSSNIPFKIIKSKQHLLDAHFINEDAICLMGANERFNEEPYIASFTNKAIHQALINQSEIYDFNTLNLKALVDVSLMSVSMFMSYFHTMMMSGITINLKHIDNDKSFNKIIKKYQPNVFAGDIASYKRLYRLDDNLLKQTYSNLKYAFIYNDYERAVVFDDWFCNVKRFNSDVKWISLLGTVETCGAFLKCELNQDILMNFGTFMGDYKPYMERKFRKPGGKLYINSDANMIGYYKNINRNNEIISKNGINTLLVGAIDKNNNFHLLKDGVRENSYINGGQYCFNIKEMIATIPGIKQVNVTISLEYENTIDCVLDADKTDSLRITSEVSSYLNSQLKNSDVNYKISFKDD